jgi:hypothetical protein
MNPRNKTNKKMVDRINRIAVPVAEALSNIGIEGPVELVKAHLEDVVNTGVSLDQYGMVVHNPELVTPERVGKNLVEAKKSIDEARKNGKHIVYIPGSYDLVHGGHASYAKQVVDGYLDAHKELKREDIYVVALVDDDDMISTVKAYKYQGFGGKEPFRRPIQSQKEFEEVAREVNPRLADMASIPALDLVAFIPSPRNSEELIQAVKQIPLQDRKGLENALRKFNEHTPLSEKDQKELSEAIVGYEMLLDSINSDYDKVVDSFASLADPDPAKRPQGPSPWSVQAWQLLVHTYLGYTPNKVPGDFVRVVSDKDVLYKDQVTFLMGEAGIQVETIADVEVVSTTKLLTMHGPDILIKAKISHYH